MSEPIILIDKDATIFMTLILTMIGGGFVGALLWSVVERMLLYFGLLYRRKLVVTIYTDNPAPKQGDAE